MVHCDRFFCGVTRALVLAAPVGEQGRTPASNGDARSVRTSLRFA
jgi:hypothetical protein